MLTHLLFACPLPNPLSKGDGSKRLDDRHGVWSCPVSGMERKIKRMIPGLDFTLRRGLEAASHLRRTSFENDLDS
jgi:hypothetical protein